MHGWYDMLCNRCGERETDPWAAMSLRRAICPPVWFTFIMNRVCCLCWWLTRNCTVPVWSFLVNRFIRQDGLRAVEQILVKAAKTKRLARPPARSASCSSVYDGCGAVILSVDRYKLLYFPHCHTVVRFDHKFRCVDVLFWFDIRANLQSFYCYGFTDLNLCSFLNRRL